MDGLPEADVHVWIDIFAIDAAHLRPRPDGDALSEQMVGGMWVWA